MGRRRLTLPVYLPFAQRREKLEAFVKALDDSRIDLSEQIPFDSWETLAAARADPASARNAGSPPANSYRDGRTSSSVARFEREITGSGKAVR